MFELDIYKINEHFFFNPKDDLKKVCNATKKGIGVYLVYELKNGRVTLVYVGSSGRVLQDGNVSMREEGLYDSIVNGEQFGGPRFKSWNKKLQKEKIDALDVYWYMTMDRDYGDIPSSVKGRVLQEFYYMNGELPRWNEEF